MHVVCKLTSVNEAWLFWNLPLVFFLSRDPQFIAAVTQLNVHFMDHQVHLYSDAVRWLDQQRAVDVVWIWTRKFRAYYHTGVVCYQLRATKFVR